MMSFEDLFKDLVLQGQGGVVVVRGMLLPELYEARARTSRSGVRLV